MSKDFNYFRIKMAYKGTNDLGAIVPIKSERSGNGYMLYRSRTNRI